MKVYMFKHILEQALELIKIVNLDDQDEIKLELNGDPISDVGISVTGQSIAITSYKED